MRLFTPRDKSLPLREVVLFGMLGALTFGTKVAMMNLPNIEPVSLMVMLFAVVFGLKGLYPTYLYVLMEILFYGISMWNLNYLYVWAILFFAAYALRKVKHPLVWALLAAAFGMLFGLFCAPVYISMGGIEFAVSWWLSGIPFDVTHCIGNFCIALILFVPLRNLLTKLYQKM